MNAESTVIENFEKEYPHLRLYKFYDIKHYWDNDAKLLWTTYEKESGVEKQHANLRQAKEYAKRYEKRLNLTKEKTNV